MEDPDEAARLSAELFQPCSDDCRPDAHAVLVFTQLGVERDELLTYLRRWGDVVALIEVPEAVNADNDDLPDGWRVWYRVAPGDHLA